MLQLFNKIILRITILALWRRRRLQQSITVLRGGRALVLFSDTPVVIQSLLQNLYIPVSLPDPVLVLHNKWLRLSTQLLIVVFLQHLLVFQEDFSLPQCLHPNWLFQLLFWQHTDALSTNLVALESWVIFGEANWVQPFANILCIPFSHFVSIKHTYLPFLFNGFTDHRKIVEDLVAFHRL